MKLIYFFVAVLSVVSYMWLIKSPFTYKKTDAPQITSSTKTDSKNTTQTKAKVPFIPVDILSNNVKWVVSSDLRHIKGSASVKFRISEKGYPFFLLNPNATVSIDGETKTIQKITSQEFDKSRYYAIIEEMEPNKDHEATFNYSFDTDPNTTKHTLPLEYYSHKFVEMGIPASKLTDRYPLELKISIKGEEDFKVFANGKVITLTSRVFKLKFPPYFNSMSFFIDIVISKNIKKIVKTIRSIDGRNLNFITYSTKDDKAVKWISTFSGIAEKTFHTLEKQLGPYPQKSLTIKISDKKNGGGAYAGALVLSSDYMEHMSHEIGHSWFLHSVTPKNGADTWIYEGFGNWAPLFGTRSGFAKDLNFRDSVHLSQGKHRLWATDDIYTKRHLRNPHQTGSSILASIDQFIKQNGKGPLKEGLMPILKIIAKERKHQTMSTMDFKSLLEKHTRLDFDELFNFYFRQE